MLFRYVGIKGVLSFMVGMFIMAWLLLSKHSMVKFLVDAFEMNSIDEIMNKKEDNPKEQGNGDNKNGGSN